MDERLQPDNSALGEAEAYRQRKTTSVLAIVFVDIVGSTRLREEMGEVRYEAIREDFELQFAAIIARDDAGAIVKGTGDGALAVFSEPSTAVERCVEVQHSLREPIKLRIGIDMGQVSVKSSFGIVADVFGRQVNRAARVEALADPGHILTSFHVYDCAVGWLTSDHVRWHNHGSTSLKGFSDKVSIHEVYDVRQCAPQSGIAQMLAEQPPQAAGEEAAQVEQHPRAPEEGVIYYSRAAIGAAVIPVRPVKVDAAIWRVLYAGLQARPLSVKPTASTALAEPLNELEQRIANIVAELRQLLPEGPSILWVDDFPENNAREHQLLRAAGCIVDLALSTGEAIDLLAGRQYFLIITDMGRGSNATAGLELIEWCATRGLVAPVFLYASPPAIAEHGEQAQQKGCALCTSGVVSLLEGIHEVLHGFYRLIPVVEDVSIKPSGKENARRGWRRWLSRS